MFALALVLASAAPARAEMDAGQYEVKEAVRSAAERVGIERQITIERDREQAGLAEQEARARESEHRRREEDERRPFPERLLTARCTACHASAYFDEKSHGWLGWQAVILRMTHLNGAELAPGERDILVAHLLDRQSPGATRTTVEFALAAGAVLLPAALARGVARHARRRRGRAPSSLPSQDTSP
ncbi:MAG TPA: hypothetical protein VD995_00820 [Azospirillum sp.]|nr:hypothetical protein [Azospirillum sp.]